MRLGCCAGEDRFEAIGDAGFDYLEPSIASLRADLSDADFEPIHARLSRFHLQPEAFNVFIPGDLKITGESVDTQGLKRHVERTTRRASALGADMIVFGSGGARNIPDGFSRTLAFEQLGFFCAMAADIASRHGITLVIEPLTATRCNLITSVAEGAELVELVSHPHLALLADLYHMELDHEPWANLIENAPVLKHIHLPVPPLEILSSEGRSFNHVLFLQTLKKTGYDGRISIEDNDKRFRNFPAEARPAAERIREIWAQS
ncbi:MAG: sugar phosphate isomerase/epimerase [bacterium]|nr:sugar phosphate isomerase/epimerase [bacterium]